MKLWLKVAWEVLKDMVVAFLWVGSIVAVITLLYFISTGEMR